MPSALHQRVSPSIGALALGIALVALLWLASCEPEMESDAGPTTDPTPTLKIKRPPEAIGKTSVTAVPPPAKPIPAGLEGELATMVFTYLNPLRSPEPPDEPFAPTKEQLRPKPDLLDPSSLREIFEQQGIQFGAGSELYSHKPVLHQYVVRNTREELEKISAIAVQQNIEQLAILTGSLRFRLEIFSLTADGRTLRLRDDLARANAGPSAERDPDPQQHAALRKEILDLCRSGHARLRDCLHVSSKHGRKSTTTSGADFYWLSAEYPTEMSFLSDRPDRPPPPFPMASEVVSENLRQSASGTFLQVKNEGHYEQSRIRAVLSLKLTHYTAEPRPSDDVEIFKIGRLYLPEAPSVRFTQKLSLYDGETRLIAAVRDPAFASDNKSAPQIVAFLTFDALTYPLPLLRERAEQLFISQEALLPFSR